MSRPISTMQWLAQENDRLHQRVTLDRLVYLTCLAAVALVAMARIYGAI